MPTALVSSTPPCTLLDTAFTRNVRTAGLRLTRSLDAVTKPIRAIDFPLTDARTLPVVSVNTPVLRSQFLTSVPTGNQSPEISAFSPRRSAASNASNSIPCAADTTTVSFVGFGPLTSYPLPTPRVTTPFSRSTPVTRAPGRMPSPVTTVSKSTPSSPPTPASMTS